MADRFRTPYVPRSTGLSPYQRGSLGELIARRGDIEAQGALASGGAWADAISRVGNIAAGAFQEYGDNKTREAEAKAKELAERPAREMAAEKQRLEIDKLRRESADAGRVASDKGIVSEVLSKSRQDAMTFLKDRPDLMPTVQDHWAKTDKIFQDLMAQSARGVAAMGYAPEAALNQLQDIEENYGISAQYLAPYRDNIKANPTPENVQKIMGTVLAKYGDEKERAAFLPKEVEAPKAGTFESYVVGKYGAKATPEQQLTARKEWEAANDRPADPIARELAMMRLAEARAEAAASAEAGRVMDQIPADKRLMIERVTNSLPKARREEWQSTLRNVVESGDEDELRSVIKQTAVEGEVAATRAAVLGREQMVAALSDAKTVLKQLKAEGVPTGFFAGTVEDLYRKLGTSTNPKYVALANQLQETLINYRRAATGAAFSDKESSQYKSMFPNYSNQFPINEALIDGLTRAAATNNQTYWTGKVGKKQAEWLLGSAERQPESDPTGRPGAFPVMGPDGKTYTFSSIAERDAFKKEAGIK